MILPRLHKIEQQNIMEAIKMEITVDKETVVAILIGLSIMTAFIVAMTTFLW